MKRAFQALVLTAAAVAAFLPAPSQAWPGSGSTCRATCSSFPIGAHTYTIHNVSQEDCCSGAALPCPSGWDAWYSWGEPAAFCFRNDG